MSEEYEVDEEESWSDQLRDLFKRKRKKYAGRLLSYLFFWLLGMATLLRYGDQIGPALVGIGLRSYRAAQRPMIDLTNEDDQYLNLKVEEAVTRTMDKFLVDPKFNLNVKKKGGKS